MIFKVTNILKWFLVRPHSISFRHQNHQMQDTDMIQPLKIVPQNRRTFCYDWAPTLRRPESLSYHFPWKDIKSFSTLIPRMAQIMQNKEVTRWSLPALQQQPDEALRDMAMCEQRGHGVMYSCVSVPEWLCLCAPECVQESHLWKFPSKTTQCYFLLNILPHLWIIQRGRTLICAPVIRTVLRSQHTDCPFVTLLSIHKSHICSDQAHWDSRISLSPPHTGPYVHACTHKQVLSP